MEHAGSGLMRDPLPGFESTHPDQVDESDQAGGTDRAGGTDQPDIEVRRSARRRRTITAYRDGGRIVVLLPQRLSRAEERRVVPEMVAKVLAKEQRSRAPGGDQELLRRAQELSRRYLADHGSPEPSSVRWVANQNNRWGSCTPGTDSIRLSDRLRPMPAWVVDYVLIHELAHLLEREHNHRFWRIVEGYSDAERAKGYLAGWSDAVAHRPDPRPGEPSN